MSAITIQNIELPVIEIKGQRVVTLAMVDKVHQRAEGTASRNFRENRQRFIEGEDYHQVSSNEIRRNSPDAIPAALKRNDVILITESGYLMLVKSFTDDLAWEVQRKLVNQYFKVHAAAVDPMAALQDPATMRGLLLSYSEKVLALESKVKEQSAKVDALDLIANADGGMCITNAAKDLQMRPKDLFKWLTAHKWIYKRTGALTWTAYQERIQQGYLEHKVTTVERDDGSTKVVEQVLVTGKGLARLAEKIRDRVA